MSAKRILKKRSSFESAKSFQQFKLPSLTSTQSEITTNVMETEVYASSLLDGRSDTVVRLPSIQELDMMIDSVDHVVLDDKNWSPSPSPAPVTPTCMTQRTLKQRRLYPALPEPRQHPPAQCHSCKSMDTPEWRKGPLGPRTLCNACGLIWIKLCKQEKKKNKHKKPPTEPCSAADTETSNKYTLSFLLC
ncbi:hypothetical protein K501DRAFT_330551 [Backusella circina FSU 941]|nr:hypothetical protein K501DRAFT_330551 [Backusella circina FSU 941]